LFRNKLALFITCHWAPALGRHSGQTGRTPVERELAGNKKKLIQFLMSDFRRPVTWHAHARARSPPPAAAARAQAHPVQVRVFLLAEHLHCSGRPVRRCCCCCCAAAASLRPLFSRARAAPLRVRQSWGHFLARLSLERRVEKSKPPSWRN